MSPARAHNQVVSGRAPGEQLAGPVAGEAALRWTTRYVTLPLRGRARLRVRCRAIAGHFRVRLRLRARCPALTAAEAGLPAPPGHGVASLDSGPKPLSSD